MVEGNLSASGVDAASVDPSAVSVVTRRERIAGGAELTVPSTRPASVWAGAELLNVEENPAIDAVTDVAGADAVRIELNDTRSTSLGVAVVSVGERSDTVADPEPAYLSVERAPTTASNGTTREVVVEVRDEYGNPVDAATVVADTDGSGGFAANTLATGEDGRATFEYTPGVVGDEVLQFGVDNLVDPAEPLGANVTVTVNAGAASAGDGGAEGINPAESGDIRLIGESTSGNTVTLTLNNTGATANITGARINFYFETSSNNREYDSARLESSDPPLVIGAV
ncbi:hypothetical protein ACFQRB_09425 [Halobaculum litoreum]|uniref:Big-1 domain-containing protein n=1 Tax=Halobaculum litoreum TaxID=3031998 RepID=A0ABD5XNB8_9EURY